MGDVAVGLGELVIAAVATPPAASMGFVALLTKVGLPAGFVVAVVAVVIFSF